MVATAKKTAGFIGRTAQSLGDAIAATSFFHPKFAIVDVAVLAALVWMKVPLI